MGVPLGLLKRVLQKRGHKFTPQQEVAMDIASSPRMFPFPIVGMMEHLFRQRRQSNVDRVAQTPTNPDPVNVMGMPDSEWRRMMQLRQQRGEPFDWRPLLIFRTPRGETVEGDMGVLGAPVDRLFHLKKLMRHMGGRNV